LVVAMFSIVPHPLQVDRVDIRDHRDRGPGDVGQQSQLPKA
jgi:hypothetical protein